MWTGILPAVTTKFDAEGRLDRAENERCFGLQIDAGCRWPHRMRVAR